MADPTISNAEDAFLDANARFQAWLKEFQVAYYKPQVDTAKKLFWQQQPENVKAELRKRAPEGASQLDELIAQRTN